MRPSFIPISKYFSDLCSCRPRKKLLGNPNGWLSAAQVFRSVQGIAQQLNHAGVTVGSCVALRMERNTEAVLILLALRLIGAIAVLTEPHTEPETCLAACTDAVQVDAVITHCEESWLLRRGGKSVLRLCLDAECSKERPVALNEDAQAPGYVIFTSGSTGKTKAVVLSDYNLINNLVEAQPLGDYQENDIALGALPLDHVFGLVLLLGTLVLGYSLYLPEHTEISSLLTAIEKERITRMNGVPSLYLAMAEQKDGYDLQSLRVGFLGGAPTTPDQFQRMEDALGMTLVSAYGMSECIGITCSDAREPSSIRGSGVGRFYSLNTGMILKEDGTAASAGEIGEVCVNGPTRMWGYWGRKMAEDELLHTGDLGYLDESGILHLTGRKKELIIRNGRNLSPKKIEDAILSLPGVRAAAVVGLPDVQTGEAPYAMVCGSVDWEALKLLLPKNELPAGILYTDRIPMTASGKPDKMQIREVLKKWKNG